MEKIREEITEWREKNDEEDETAGRRVSALTNKEHEERKNHRGVFDGCMIEEEGGG